MIRKGTPDDLEAVLTIWLEASLHAHDFIEPAFWQSKLEDMRNHYLPSADVWVFEENDVILGFFALQAHVLAALFVSPSQHGRGIGSRLLEKAKSLADGLELSVYQRNNHAVAFYQRHGFRQIDLRTDARAGHVELVMKQIDEMAPVERQIADQGDVALLIGSPVPIASSPES